MRDIVNLKEWQENIEKIYANAPASCRPKKARHKPRSAAKRKALAVSCKKAWDEWLATGFLVATEKGFKLCPNATK